MRISEWMAESGVKFGTSGARGLVSRMDDRLCFVYATGFLKHLENLGEFGPGTKVALGGDLRPSTPRIVRACAAAVRRLGGEAGHDPGLKLLTVLEEPPGKRKREARCPVCSSMISFIRSKSAQ